MERIRHVEKLTDNPYLNLYQFSTVQRSGKHSKYYVSSRTKDPQHLKAGDHHTRPDGVILYGVYGEQKDRLVLIRQYRYPIGGYVYEFPAGLLDEGETAAEAGIREMFEETGLNFRPMDGDCYQRPFFTSVGMTDESCAMCFGYQESSEDIQVVLADRDECRRILKEENVAVMCAYMMMHFIAFQGDPLEFVKER